jgi:dTDP-4-amino-4,6-dideoxygalactose transaminase
LINVTKTFLPSFDEYTNFLIRAWDKAWLTNNGELLQELEQKLKAYLGVDDFLFCSNGTIVLQMAIKVLGITKEVITTPFSYVATTNAILWEGCKPVFVDIREDSYCIDETKIEAAITEDTEAILATHVYGLPCNIEAIEALANKYNLRVIYDAAHAFGCTYKGKSLLNYGDISTCSFHATKLFHTVEGGCIITNNKQLNERLYLYRSFGHIGDDYYSEGINAKNSEFHAAMGLAVLPYMSQIIGDRKQISKLYDSILPAFLGRPFTTESDFDYNYAYYPVVFETEEQLLLAKNALLKDEINSRRYFYPSLNNLPQVSHLNQTCPVSENISKRVLSLPLYPGFDQAEKVINIIKAAVL